MAEKTLDIKGDFAKFYEVLVKQFPVRELLLFGSYANGGATKDSDIDIAVIMDRIPGKNKFDIGSTLFLLAGKINPIIEPKCIYWDEYLNPEPASILSEIIRTAVRV